MFLTKCTYLDSLKLFKYSLLCNVIPKPLKHSFPLFRVWAYLIDVVPDIMSLLSFYSYSYHMSGYNVNDHSMTSFHTVIISLQMLLFYECFKGLGITLHNNEYLNSFSESKIKNKNKDILFTAHDAFLEYPHRVPHNQKNKN
jgi:hypothetical protein